MTTFREKVAPVVSRGVPVTPVLPNSKRAFLPDWPTSATTDWNKIEEWGRVYGDDYNYAAVALAKSDGTWFLEIDSRAALERIQKETGQEIPDTFSVRSRPGRGHFYWKQTAASIAMGNLSQSYVKNGDWSARVDNQYVVGPGSIHPESKLPYEALGDDPIVPAPDWLVAWCVSQKIEKKSKSADITDDIPREERGLIQNGDGRVHGFMLHHAGQLRQKGLEEEAIRLSLYDLVKKNCAGPIDYKKVDAMAKSVCIYPAGQNTDVILTQKPAQLATPASTTSAKSDANIGEAIQRAMRADGPRVKRPFDYEGLIPSAIYCLWLGAMKAEKSLFALRKAMHDACGKDWLNSRNLIGPIEVMYFDSENDGDEVDDRWDELLIEFDVFEQGLIEQNLHVVKGKKLARKEKISIEYDNTALWLKLAELYPNAKVIYLDCWYQLQNIKSADAGAQKIALEMFESYFPGRTLFLLHHTGREDSESLQKKKPIGLHELGPERWSNRVSQSIVVLKKADLIICQEKRYDTDDEGARVGEYVDFQVYSRSGAGMPLLTFEPVYTDEHGEYKYRRKLLTNLTTSAASVMSKIRDKGPWLTKRALVNEVGGGGRQYLVLAELQFKGFLMHDDRGYWFKEDAGIALADASKNPVALKQAEEFLKRILSSGPIPETMVQQLAKSEGVLLGPPIRYTGCRSYLNKEDGQHYWTMSVRDEDEMTAREIRRLIDANPTATKERLAELAKCSKRVVERAVKTLGLVKSPGRSCAWRSQRVENAES